MIAFMVIPTRSMILDRGPMPFVSIATCVLAIIIVLVKQPRTCTQYFSCLLLSLVPLIAGVVGYYIGVASASSGWREFLATNPSEEVIEQAELSLQIGYAVAADPVHIGVLFSVPALIVSTIVYVVRKAIQKADRQ